MTAEKDERGVTLYFILKFFFFFFSFFLFFRTRMLFLSFLVPPY